MRIGRTRFEGPWGQVVMLLLFVSFTIWYFQDAYRASSNIQNLLLIAPASALVLAVALPMLVLEARRLRLVREEATRTEADSRPFRERFGPYAAMVALLVYTLAMPHLGFDIATFVFIAAGMAIHGERRLLVLIGFPAIVTAGVIYALKNILFTPVPTLLLG